MPDLLCGRYHITPDPPRRGGMAEVRKAYDIQTNSFVALKLLKPAADERRARDSFGREARALGDLQHANIVKFLEFNVGPDGNPFIVLEWVEDTLDAYLARYGALSWEDYYSALGRPLLDAVRFAQSRGIVHRDIKPKNILMSGSVPKISDYGISRYLDDFNPAGITFAGFGSPPFTPQEDDDGRYSRGRDVYSLAALATYCMSRSLPEQLAKAHTKESKYRLLVEVLGEIALPDEIRSVLTQALTDDPARRPINASSLVAEIDKAIATGSARRPARRTCYAYLSERAKDRLRVALDASAVSAIEATVVDEINERSAFSQYRDRDDRIPSDLTIWAVTWVFRARRGGLRQESLELIDAWQMAPSEIERLRERACTLPVDFSLQSHLASDSTRTLIDDIYTHVARHEAEHAARSKEQEQLQYFRTLYAWLNVKSELEKEAQEAIAYGGKTVLGDSVTLGTDATLSDELIGTDRVIRRIGAAPILVQIEEVGENEVVVRPSNAAVGEIPESGKLTRNTLQELRAIERQRIALDSIRYDRSVSPHLKPILIDASTARPPIPVAKVDEPSEEFGEDKLSALQAALGVQDVVAIQGPPGTGKTSLITEIINQYLKHNPDHRILLSSQTHIALDNVIERLVDQHPKTDIIRVGKIDDPKISDLARPMLLDTRAEAWAKEVTQRAEAFMEEWSAAHGVSRTEVLAGILVERLIKLLEAKSAQGAKLQSVRTEVAELSQAEERIAEDPSAGSSIEVQEALTERAEDLSEVEQLQKVLQREEKRIRDQLRDRGGDVAGLADADLNDLREWLAVLIPDRETAASFRERIELLEEWVLRVGKTSDFHPLIIGTSRIIAGTCVGIAAVRGLQDVSFDLCIVDEASKATMTEILVPMARSRKWILVGDPKQLPPFIEERLRTDNELLSSFGLSLAHVRETLLDRFLRMLPGHSVRFLTKQYRMVREIGDLVSNCFYDGKLESAGTAPYLRLSPTLKKPVTWLSTSAASERRERRVGESFQNTLEAQRIKSLLQSIQFLLKAQGKTAEVAIVAGYLAQVRLLDRIIASEREQLDALRVSVNTVDAVQGRQADVCIYSVVRSNEAGTIGFLRELPRLNVALSRAKSALVIFGDHSFCATAQGDNPFRAVIRHIEDTPNDCSLVEALQ